MKSEQKKLQRFLSYSIQLKLEITCTLIKRSKTYIIVNYVFKWESVGTTDVLESVVLHRLICHATVDDFIGISNKKVSIFSFWLYIWPLSASLINIQFFGHLVLQQTDTNLLCHLHIVCFSKFLANSSLLHLKTSLTKVIILKQNH